MSAALTRRAALSGAVASVALVGAAAAATMPIRQPDGISPALTDLLQVAKKAESVVASHDRDVCSPAQRACKAAKAAAENSVPHITVDAGESAMGGRIIWTSDRPRMAHTVVAMAKEGREWSPEYIAAARRIVANDLRRQRAVSRTERANNISSIIQENNDLNDAWVVAMDAVAAFPAAIPADLHAKLKFMIAYEMGDGQDWLPELLADAARLAKVEASA